MAELSATLDDVQSGRGRIAMLVGEPGIGKTRLTEELETIGVAQGVNAGRGACIEVAGAPPYVPWIQIIRTLIADDSADIQAAAADHAHAIAELVPEFYADETFQSPETNLDPAQARFRLFESITSFLISLSTTRPLMLVLEDLHWADRPSLELLEFVSQGVSNTPILIVCTYRDEEISRKHPLSETLAKLARIRGFQRIAVSGLDRTSVGLLFESFGEVAVPSELIETIHSRTEGDPFFVIEIARDILREASMHDGRLDSATLRIPDGVREAVGLRLNKLPDDCYKILQTASIIGRQFDFKMLSSLHPELTGQQVRVLIEDAVGARVLREHSTAVDRYEFVHALIQETLAAELSASTRMQTHDRIISAIENLYPDRISEYASELAQHCFEAQTVVSEEKTIRYATLAGEQAIAGYSWIEARSYFEQALDTLGDLSRDAERATILAGLGTAELFTLTYPYIQRGWDHVAQAFDLFEKLEDPESAVRVVMRSRGFPPIWMHDTLDVISRALGMVTPNSVNEGILLIPYSAAVRFENMDSKGYEDSLERALKIALRTPNVYLEALVLRGMSWIKETEADYRGAIKLRNDALQLAKETDQPFEEVWSRIGLYEAQLTIGDIDAALRNMEALHNLEERFGYQAVGLHGQYLLAYLLSDLSEIKRLGPAIEDVHADDSVNRILVGIGDWHTEEPSDMDQRFQAAFEEAQFAPNQWQRMVNISFLALAAWITGRTNASIEAGEIARSVLASTSLIPELERRARIAAGLAAVTEVDAVEARDQYQRLVNELKGTLPYFLPFSGDRLLGLLAHTAGMPDEASKHFEDALEFCTRARYRLEAIWTARDYAETLLRRMESSDDQQEVSRILDRAITLLDDARANAQDIGTRPLDELLRVLQERAASIVVPNSGHPDGLTSREVEVLRLLAAGSTNQQIADDLVIALNTARTHVANILDKIGAANRTEAAIYASQKGLSSS